MYHTSRNHLSIDLSVYKNAYEALTLLYSVSKNRKNLQIWYRIFIELNELAKSVPFIMGYSAYIYICTLSIVAFFKSIFYYNHKRKATYIVSNSL